MARLAAFLHKSPGDQRALLQASTLHVIVTIAIRMLPFAQLRRLLAHIAEWGPGPASDDDADARVVGAVRTVASLLPGGSCLTEALVAQCLLSRYRRETTLCFGVARIAADGRPFDAHAWLERGGTGVIGAREVAYDLLTPPRRCASSQPPR